MRYAPCRHLVLLLGLAILSGCDLGGQGNGGCTNGMKDGESRYDGCNTITCEDGEIWTTDADCSCFLEDGQSLAMNETISMDDSCTVCKCVAWTGLECDASACAPGEAAGYCRNGMREGQINWYGCSGIECRAGEVWELDGDCGCELVDGTLLHNGGEITEEDGCTVCTCACSCGPDWTSSFSCDSSGCAPTLSPWKW